MVNRLENGLIKSSMILKELQKMSHELEETLHSVRFLIEKENVFQIKLKHTTAFRLIRKLGSLDSKPSTHYSLIDDMHLLTYRLEHILHISHYKSEELDVLIDDIKNKIDGI